MNKNKFKIFSSWDPRPETPSGLGQRMLMNIDSLARISPYLRNWWFSDPSLRVTDMLDEGVEAILAKIRARSHCSSHYIRYLIKMTSMREGD